MSRHFLSYRSVLCVAVAVTAGFWTAGFARPGGVALTAPTITSTGKFGYVSGESTNFVGTPGRFTLSDPGSTITGFDYFFEDGAPTYIAAGPRGLATVAVTPNSPELLELSVAAVDGQDSSPGPVTTFDIEPGLPVGNVAALAWWRLNGGKGTAETDGTGYGKTAKLTGDAMSDCANAVAPNGYRCSLSVGGQGGQALAAPSLLPVLSLDGSATVSAWVNVSKCSNSCVALSEDGAPGYSFALGYQRICHAAGKAGACWKLTMSEEGSTPPVVITVASAPGSAKLSSWTQLTAEFYAEHGQLLLYVNGAQQGQGIPYSPSNGATGYVRIGDVMPGGTTNDWDGRISDVCLFYGPMPASDVSLLYRGNAAHPHDGCAALV